MSIKCDVLIVGAGPAGSSAARSAVMNGAKTILIDKKEEIGIPVQCAEGIGEYLFSLLPFEIPKEQLIWNIDGMLFWAENISIEKTGGYWKGYSIDRTKFDKWLSELAVNNGAELWTNTELIDLEPDEENNIKKAIVKRNGKHIEILSKVIIAADGCESTVLKLLELYNPKKGDLAEVYSWEMKDLNLYKPHFEQIFFGDFAPKGYAYIFPKSKDIANIGIGGTYPKKKMEIYFEEFMEINHVKKQVKNAELIVEKSKKAVWNNLTDEWIHGNIIFTGDVANQNLKPFIEGILPAIICGNIAGKFAFDLCFKQNIDNEQYKKQVKKIFDAHLIISNEMQECIEYLYAKDTKKKYLQFLGIITELFHLNMIKENEDIDYNELKSRLLKLRREI